MNFSKNNSPCEIGVPVKTVRNGSLVRGRDAEGRECLYAVMSQEGSDIGIFLLRIDLATGQSVRTDMPAGTGNGPRLWSECWGRFFMYVSAGMHGAGRLLEFDPAEGEARDLGQVESRKECLACSLAEAPDGTLYLGTYGAGCSLNSYRPDTGQFHHYGVVDPDEFYFYVQCGSDGTVAGLVKMAHPHVVALDIDGGTCHPVGPVADTNLNQGRVELVKGADGLLYIDSHEGVFRLNGTTLTTVDAIPRASTEDTLEDGSTFRFLDGRQDNVWLTRYRTIEIRKPDGKRRILEPDYVADGTPIYIMRAGTDGKIYGSSILPLHLFSYDPATDALIHHGACCTPSGEIYSMDCMSGNLYFCSYTHAILSEFDLSRPFNWGGPVPDQPGEFKKGISGDNFSYAYGPDDNPKQLGRMDTVSYRPRDMVAGPAGKVWVVSIPDYGMWGGCSPGTIRQPARLAAHTGTSSRIAARFPSRT